MEEHAADDDYDAEEDSLRVVAFSDTHNMHEQLSCPFPDGDVLVCAGDWTQKGTSDETAAFASWLSGLPHPVKLVVRGNHEAGPFSEFTREHLCQVGGPSVRYLDNEAVEVKVRKLHCLPSTVCPQLFALN